MSRSKPHILSTVSLDSSLTGKITAQGMDVDVLPFIQTLPLADGHLKAEIKAIAQHRATVIFTSANAVHAVLALIEGSPSGWQIFCTSGATKDLLINAFGEQCIAGTADNAASLAERIINAGNIKEAFFFCGNKRRDELPAQLSAAGININEKVVYNTLATPHKLTEQYDAILFFSPSGVESYCTVNKINEDAVLFAIGNTTAGALKQFNNKLIISAIPAKEKVIDDVIAYYKTNNEKTNS